MQTRGRGVLRRAAAAAGLSQHTTQPLLPPRAFTHSKSLLVLLEVFLEQTPPGRIADPVPV